MLAAQLPMETPVHCLAQLVVEALPLPLALVEVDATAAARGVSTRSVAAGAFERASGAATAAAAVGLAAFAAVPLGLLRPVSVAAPLTVEGVAAPSSFAARRWQPRKPQTRCPPAGPATAGAASRAAFSRPAVWKAVALGAKQEIVGQVYQFGVLYCNITSVQLKISPAQYFTCMEAFIELVACEVELTLCHGVPGVGFQEH